jgi:hypothetical protein
MRNGLHIPAWLVRTMAIVGGALLASVAAREVPALRRYVKSERM